MTGAEKQRRYMAAHPGRQAASSRAYEARNREARNLRQRAVNPQTQPGVVTSYSGVHNLLRRERGPASAHTCPCGRPAFDWAFDEPSGFSTDLTRYTALCRPCHQLKDRGQV